MSPAKWRGRQVGGWIFRLSLAGLILFGPGAYEWVRLSLRHRHLEQRLAALKAEQERLTQEEQRVETDPTYVEGLIRSTFKVARPGEYVIPLDTSDPSTRRP